MPQNGYEVRVLYIAQGVCVITRVAPLRFGHYGSLENPRVCTRLNNGKQNRVKFGMYVMWFIVILLLFRNP